MKVLLLNGSANKKGNTFTALSEIANRLEKNGVEAEIMQLGNQPVRGCIACGQSARQNNWDIVCLMTMSAIVSSKNSMMSMRSSWVHPSIMVSPTEL